jgi:hypothetical protein
MGFRPKHQQCYVFSLVFKVLIYSNQLSLVYFEDIYFIGWHNITVEGVELGSGLWWECDGMMWYAMRFQVCDWNGMVVLANYIT